MNVSVPSPTPVPASAPRGDGEASTYRRILQSSGTYSLAVLAQRMASILLLPLYTHYLSPGEYGKSELLDLTISLFGILAGANLASAIPFFYFRSEDQAYRMRLRSTALLGALLVGSVGCAVGLFAAPWFSHVVFQNATDTRLFRIVFLSFGCSLPFEAALAWFRAIDHPRAFVAASIGKLVCQIVFNGCFLVIGKMGIAGVLWGNLAAVAIGAVVLLSFSLGGSRPAFDLSLFWQIIKYAAPVGIVWFSTFTINFGDRYFLQRHVTLDQVGLYSLAYKAAMLLSAVQTPFSAYWNAQVFKLLRQDDAQEVYRRVFTYYMFAMTTAAVVIVLFSSAMLTLMADPAYRSAYVLIPPLVLAYLIRAANDYFRALLYTTRNVKLDAKIYSIAAVVGLAGYFVLIPRFHVWGAVEATLAAFVTVAFLGYREAFKAWPFQLESGRLVKLFTSAGLVVWLFLALRPAGLPGQIGFALVLTPGYLALLAATAFFSQREKEVVRRGLSNLWTGRFPSSRE